MRNATAGNHHLRATLRKHLHKDRIQYTISYDLIVICGRNNILCYDISQRKCTYNTVIPFIKLIPANDQLPSHSLTETPRVPASLRIRPSSRVLYDTILSRGSSRLNISFATRRFALSFPETIPCLIPCSIPFLIPFSSISSKIEYTGSDYTLIPG